MQFLTVYDLIFCILKFVIPRLPNGGKILDSLVYPWYALGVYTEYCEADIIYASGTLRLSLSYEAESFKTYNSFWNNEKKTQKTEDEVSLEGVHTEVS